MSTQMAPTNGNGNKPLSKTAEFNSLLERSKGQIAKALPRHLTPERMIRMAVTAFSSTPLLQECDVTSIVGCVVKASELGLELTGPLGHAYMVPRKNKGRWEANFQVGYRGFIDLAYRTGRVKTFCAHEVRAGDNFDYQYGTDPYVIHKPAQTGDGEITHVYAVCIQTNGGIDFEVMTADQVDAHAKKYSDSLKSEYSPWNTAWAEMAKKTVIRKLAKRVPLSAEFAKALTVDEAAQNDTPIMIGAPEEPPAGRTKIKSELPPDEPTTDDHGEIAEDESTEEKKQPPTDPDFDPESTTQSLIERAKAAKSPTKLEDVYGAWMKVRDKLTAAQSTEIKAAIDEAKKAFAAK